jgi:hypothetical protein
MYMLVFGFVMCWDRESVFGGALVGGGVDSLVRSITMGFAAEFLACCNVGVVR